MEKFLEQLSEILDVSSEELSPKTKLAGLDTWDSLAAVSLTAMADIEYQKRLDARKFSKCETVEDLYGLIVDGQS